jgi:hypothetical protein
MDAAIHLVTTPRVGELPSDFITLSSHHFITTHCGPLPISPSLDAVNARYWSPWQQTT